MHNSEHLNLSGIATFASGFDERYKVISFQTPDWMADRDGTEQPYWNDRDERCVKAGAWMIPEWPTRGCGDTEPSTASGIWLILTLCSLQTHSTPACIWWQPIRRDCARALSS